MFVPGGAIEAFVRAEGEGIVSWIGITGHTEQAPVVHAEALCRLDFDSVLTPVNNHLYSATCEDAAGGIIEGGTEAPRPGRTRGGRSASLPPRR